MDKGFIKSKINIPKVKDKLVKRVVLFDKLNEAINYKLTLVTAPAGFGKSTLVSSWLNFNIKNKYFNAWISLDERDGDPLIFWKYILYSLDKIKEGIMESSFYALNSVQFNYGLETEILSAIIYEWNDLNKCKEYAIKALELGKKGEIMWVLCTSYMILAKVFFANANIEVATEYMEKAEKITVNAKVFDVETELEVVRENMLLRTENFEEAEKWISNEVYNKPVKYSIAYAPYYITKLRYFILKNLLNEAEKLAHNLYENFENRKIYKVFA